MDSSGPATSRYAPLQAVRLAQVRTMPPEAIEGLLGRMAGARTLPALDYHFQRHGKVLESLGVATPEDYEQLFREHIGRTDLRYFTCIHPRFGTKMWYLIGMDNGLVAQYNETRQTHWSFYRVTNLDRFLEYGSGWWVEARQTATGWEFSAWVRRQSSS